jgi:hypothetical protein
MSPIAMNTRAAAAFLGIGRTKLLELFRAKRIKAKDIDGRLLFTTQSLQAFLDGAPDASETERQAPSPVAVPRRRRRRTYWKELKAS